MKWNIVRNYKEYIKIPDQDILANNSTIKTQHAYDRKANRSVIVYL